MPQDFKGLCIGGPLNGQMKVHQHTYLRVRVLPPLSRRPLCPGDLLPTSKVEDHSYNFHPSQYPDSVPDLFIHDKLTDEEAFRLLFGK